MDDPAAQQRALTEANKRVMQESFLMKRATVSERRKIVLSSDKIHPSVGLPDPSAQTQIATTKYASVVCGRRDYTVKSEALPGAHS